MSKRKKPSRQTLIIGRKPVKEALERKDASFEKIWILDRAGGPEIEAIRREAAVQSIPLQFVPEVRLKRLGAEGNHQGVIAVVAPVSFWDVDAMMQRVAGTRDEVKAKKPIILALDRIEDPQNYGAILRSALAAGVGGVIVPLKEMAPLNEAAIKASAGAALQIPIARVNQLRDVLYQLKERGYWIVGADTGSEETYASYDWNRPVAIVMGSERSGLHPRIKAECDVLVSIPMYGPVESLNVSVATALLIFAARTARQSTESSTDH